MGGERAGPAPPPPPSLDSGTGQTILPVLGLQPAVFCVEDLVHLHRRLLAQLFSPGPPLQPSESQTGAIRWVQVECAKDVVDLVLACGMDYREGGGRGQRAKTSSAMFSLSAKYGALRSLALNSLAPTLPNFSCCTTFQMPL